MKFRWAIQAKSNMKIFFSKKTAPIFIDQDSISLDSVKNTLLGGLIFPLNLDYLMKVVQT